MSTLLTIAQLMRQTRLAGIVLYVDVDNRVRAIPGDVVRKDENRPLMLKCSANQEGIKKWLQLMASHAPTSPEI